MVVVIWSVANPGIQIFLSETRCQEEVSISCWHATPLLTCQIRLLTRFTYEYTHVVMSHLYLWTSQSIVVQNDQRSSIWKEGPHEYDFIGSPLQHKCPQDKEEEILLSPMTNAHTPTEKYKKHRDNIKKRHQNFDYTTIADQLRTVSRSNSNQPTGVVKPVYGRPPSH